MDQNGHINHSFGKWLSCDELTKNTSWLFLIQPSSGSLFTKMDESPNYVSMIATTKRKNYATYNSNDDSHLTQHLPNDCIPTNLRMNRKRELVVATFNNPDLAEKTIMKNQSELEDCFIENTIVHDTSHL
jgi:hypothetical protein